MNPTLSVVILQFPAILWLKLLLLAWLVASFSDPDTPTPVGRCKHTREGRRAGGVSANMTQTMRTNKDKLNLTLSVNLSSAINATFLRSSLLRWLFICVPPKPKK